MSDSAVFARDHFVHEIEQLATLVRERNDVSTRITELIGRPAQIGHIGEWLAARIFDIALEESAVAKGIDGGFRSGPLQGKTVNVKFYAKREGLLAVREDALPDYYLVLTGPRSITLTSRGEARLWYIDAVYLFNAIELHRSLCQSGIRIDPCATSIRGHYWERAEIYPAITNTVLPLDANQRSLLELFSSRAVNP